MFSPIPFSQLHETSSNFSAQFSGDNPVEPQPLRVLLLEGLDKVWIFSLQQAQITASHANSSPNLCTFLVNHDLWELSSSM